jgi:DNA-directed RNA polymerase specialized sigma24 family protein
MTAQSDPSTDGFERLLGLLDGDADRAAGAYAEVRRRLIKFFEWRRCFDAESCADDTLDRVARRLAAGVTMTSTIHAFILGVAVNVARERFRVEPHVELSENLPAPFDGDPLIRRDEQQREEQRLSCLARCLSELPAEQRKALVRYHEGQARSRIVARQRMAAALGIPLQALRLRMFRIRETLERCIRNCVAIAGPE